MISFQKIFVLVSLMAFIEMKYPIYIQTNDGTPVNILLFADFGYPHSLVNINQITCSDHPSCQIKNEEIEKDTYLGKEYEYQAASIKIKVPSKDNTTKSKEKYTEVELPVRLNTSFNLLGLNDISGFINAIPWEHEIVLDLKNNSILLQEYNNKGTL